VRCKLVILTLKMCNISAQIRWVYLRVVWDQNISYL